MKGIPADFLFPPLPKINEALKEEYEKARKKLLESFEIPIEEKRFLGPGYFQRRYECFILKDPAFVTVELPIDWDMKEKETEE